MELNQLLQDVKELLPSLTPQANEIWQNLLNSLHSMTQLAQNIGQLKTRSAADLNQVLILQRQCGDLAEQQLSNVSITTQPLLRELLKRADLLAASIEMATLDLPDYPVMSLMPGSKVLKDIMRSFYTNPKLNQSISLWLTQYDLKDKIDPGEIIMNGLRILARSLAMGHLRSTEKALPFLLATCKNHIRDLRQAPQYKSHLPLDEGMALKPNPQEQAEALSDGSKPMSYDQYLQRIIRPVIQKAVQEIKGKCRDLLLLYFKEKFAVDFSQQPPTSSTTNVVGSGAGNYVYECLGKLRTRLTQETELLQTLQNIGLYVH